MPPPGALNYRLKNRTLHKAAAEAVNHAGRWSDSQSAAAQQDAGLCSSEVFSSAVDPWSRMQQDAHPGQCKWLEMFYVCVWNHLSCGLQSACPPINPGLRGRAECINASWLQLLRLLVCLQQVTEEINTSDSVWWLFHIQMKWIRVWTHFYVTEWV